MSDPMIQIDPGLLAEFIDESSEALSSLDHLFIDLEKAPSDLAIVGAIFRPVHSIKGNSAFFGLNKIKTLAHESETLLDMVRNGALAVTPDLISVLLSATDELKAMFDRVRDAQPQIIEEAVYDSLIQRIKSTASQDNEHTIWRSIFEKLQKLTDEMGSQAKELAEPLLVLVDELKRVCPKSDDHAAAPTSDAEPSPLQAIRQIIHEPFEEYLPDDKAALIPPALVQLQEIADGDQTLQLIDDTLETYNTFFSTVGIDTLAADLLNDKLDLLASDGKWRQTSTPAEKDSKSKSAPSPPAPTAPKPAPHTEASKTMRVPEAHIDTFLEYVGELLVVGDMFSYLEKRLASGESGTDIVSNFRQANQTFATLSNNLQVSIMSIRKVTVSMLLQKVPRLVRDIATASGKQIDVQIAGEQTEIDKSLVDMLDAPLTHMVRNAADHGVEAPDVRLAAQKDAQGHIRVAVEEHDNAIVLSVQDDGAGLNYDAIQKKAESMGLVKPGQQLTQDDVIKLLFSSGVSTAAQVTDVSGRGVGMDVVKRMIEEAGGTIIVESTAGQGSRFEVRLPKSVTTQIMEGYLVAQGRHRYVLPMNKVHETARVARSGIRTVIGRGRCIVRHDKVMPVISLSEALGLNDTRKVEQELDIMVTIETRNGKVAMIVDDVLGVQQVVLRQIEGLQCETELIAGGALMGDGSVALIINTECLSGK